MGGKTAGVLRRPRYAMPAFVREALDHAGLREVYDERSRISETTICGGLQRQSSRRRK